MAARRTQDVSREPDLFASLPLDEPVTPARAATLIEQGFPSLSDIPAGWQRFLAEELDRPYMCDLRGFLAEELHHRTIHPPRAAAVPVEMPVEAPVAATNGSDEDADSETQPGEKSSKSRSRRRRRSRGGRGGQHPS